MSAQHTPAPWHQFPPEPFVGLPIIQDANGRDLAFVRDGWEAGLEGGQHLLPPEEIKANARLMATAPELLTVAKNARFRLSEMQFDIIRGGQPNDTPEVQRLVDELDAVIEKAEATP